MVICGTNIREGRPLSVPHGRPSSKQRERKMASDRRIGSLTPDQRGTFKLMQRAKVPWTRENYLQFEYLGDVPKELGAEEEANLPLEFQKQRPEPKLGEPKSPKQSVHPDPKVERTINRLMREKGVTRERAEEMLEEW